MSITPAPSGRPPAGWYPDPSAPGNVRYWDGVIWTEHRQPAPPTTPPVGGGQWPAGPLAAGTYRQAPYAQAPYAQSYGGPVVAPKNPALSLLVSFFIPGVGSMINGDTGRGVGILVGYLVSCVLIIVIIGIFGVIGFWIWGLVDAYQGAQRWNARHGILS